jgi:hypothetical protein
VTAKIEALQLHGYEKIQQHNHHEDDRDKIDQRTETRQVTAPVSQLAFLADFIFRRHCRQYRLTIIRVRPQA